MQKSLLLLGLAAGMMCTPAVVSAKGTTPSKVQQAMAKANRKSASMSAETVARLYHPETITSEDYDRDENEWVDPYVKKYTYNKAGQILTETSENSQSKYTYNEDGLLIKCEEYGKDDGEFKLNQTEEYTYDDVVKNLVIKVTTTYQDWTSGEVAYSNIYGTEITRNSDGNIIKVRDYSFWDDSKHYGTTLDIEYGADKKAVKITEYDDYDVYETLTDIVWDTTDGQILSFEYDDYNGDMYFSNNRIASATIIDDDYSEPAKFTATYDGDSYHSKLMVGQDVALEINFECIEKFAGGEDFDNCYSYNCTSIEVDFDYDGDAYYIDYTKEETIENRADAFGINLSNKTVATYKYTKGYEDETEIEESKTEVTYDETVGYPLTAVEYSTSYETGELVPRTRKTFSDYVNVDPAGVSTVVVDENAEPVYYNLQGIRVDGALAPGLYICRKGNTTTKVIIR